LPWTQDSTSSQTEGDSTWSFLLFSFHNILFSWIFWADTVECNRGSMLPFSSLESRPWSYHDYLVLYLDSMSGWSAPLCVQLTYLLRKTSPSSLAPPSSHLFPFPTELNPHCRGRRVLSTATKCAWDLVSWEVVLIQKRNHSAQAKLLVANSA
jgi:hypothetical protein